mgnify:CR=1 FL=1
MSTNEIIFKGDYKKKMISRELFWEKEIKLAVN